MSTCRAISVLDVKDFAAETVRVGDLDGNGAPDLLFAQSTYGNRKITCLTATDTAGKVLWQHGTPDPGNGRIYSDLPVQVYDWDGDGANEVLYVEQATYAELHDPGATIVERAKRYEGQATMVVLDGRTGEWETTIPLPAPADDCFLFADLTGRGYRKDFVVKDRYWNMWGTYRPTATSTETAVTRCSWALPSSIKTVRCCSRPTRGAPTRTRPMRYSFRTEAGACYSATTASTAWT